MVRIRNSHDEAASPTPGQGTAVAFAGYPRPTSNTTYTPNQFFDVVLPHSSRGVVRLVGYMLRKVLGWSNKDGTPREPQVRVSYAELIESAGISRGAIRQSIDEALDANFITCVAEGQPKLPDQDASSALFELKWDDSAEYQTDPEKFQGFFAGNGNLTYIPNAFFDYTIRNESLAIVRVVGAVIRHSIGFQTRFGFRRQEVSLSFDDLMRITRLGSRSTLNLALKEAEASGHIVRVQTGAFGHRTQLKGTYAIHWATKDAPEPANTDQPLKTRSVQKSNQENAGVFEFFAQNRPRRIGSKIAPASVQKSNQDRFKNRTSIEITGNNTLKKQQQQEATNKSEQGDAAAAFGQSFALLKQAGFDDVAATQLARRFTPERILRQIQWLPKRQATRSRLGLLRTAIEADYPPPPELSNSEDTAGGAFARCYYAAYHGDDLGISQPFSKDPQLAADYLSKLPVSGDAQSLGTAFGNFVRQKHSTERNAKPFLSSAINAFGTQFAKTLARQASKKTEAERKQAKEAHEKANWPNYVDYLRERNRDLQKVPAVLAEFENHREAGFRALKQFGIDPERHRTEQGRLLALIDYFEKRADFKVLAFWDWDRSVNPAPFLDHTTAHRDRTSQ